MGWFEGIGSYIEAVREHWLQLTLTGVLPGALGISQVVGEFTVALPPGAWFGIAGGGVVVAQFRTWRDLRRDHDHEGLDFFLRLGRDLEAETLTSDVAVAEWNIRYDEWKRYTDRWLSARSVEAAGIFNDSGKIAENLPLVPGAHGEHHSRLRTFLARQCAALESIDKAGLRSTRPGLPS